MRINYPDVLAFTVGLVIMGMELTAGRFVAPYFGTSTLVWTNVIAIIMVALALGYSAGGRLAERRPDLKALQVRLMIGAVVLGCIPFVVEPIFNRFLVGIYQITNGSAAVFLGSFLLIAVLFFIPAFLFAMTSPFLVGWRAKQGNTAAASAGHVFAIGTIGSIIGTFLPTVLLVPLLGSKRTMLLFAGLLFVLTLPALFRTRRAMAAMTLPVFLFPFGLSPSLRSAVNVLAEEESSYQYIQVVEENGTRRLVFNEGGGYQSSYRPGDIVAGASYYEMIALTPAMVEKDHLDVLILGLAGGTISREMDLLYPDKDLQITGVEIDGQVVELAKEYFDLERDRLEIVTMDARSYLRTTDKTFDIIVIDAYSNQMYIPSHLVTEEFFEEVKEHLSPEGIAVFNVNAASHNSTLLRTLNNTFAAVFPYVGYVHIPDFLNYVVMGTADGRTPVAKNTPLALQSMGAVAVEGWRDYPYLEAEKIFTDDWAPVEWMTDSMVWEYLTQPQ